MSQGPEYEKHKVKWQAAEGCGVLETVGFVDERPGRSPHSRCHGVPDTERYKKKGGGGGVAVCVNVSMRKTRGGVKPPQKKEKVLKTAGETGIQQI